MTADHSEKSEPKPCAECGEFHEWRAPEGLPPIDVTLEICAESIARRNPCEPEISPVPVKARAELHAATWKVGRQLADLFSAAESVERHCPISAELGQLYTVTLSGAQILALRSAIAIL